MSRSTRTTKSILISGYYGFGNTGDEAILAAIIHQLRQRIPDCHLTVISGNPEWTNRDHADVEAISWLDLTQIISAIEAADLVLCGGGGLFHDYWGVNPDTMLRAEHRGISFYAEAPFLAALLGKPTMMYGVGVGPLYSDEARQIVKCVFNLAHVITVRDAESKKLLEAIGVESNRIEVTTDPAFAVLPEEFLNTTAFWEDKGPRIGVVVRHWDFKVFPGYWERVVAEALDRFLAEVNGQALFIPFQAVEGRQENDRAVIQRVRGQMEHGERCHSLDAPLVPAKMAGLIASCDLAIGMRLHSLIFAITAGVPMVALSYDPKVSSLMNRIEFEQFCLELKDISEEKLLNTLRYAWAMRAESQQRLKVLSTRLRNLAERNADLAVDLILAKYLAPVTRDPDTIRMLARIIAAQTKALYRQDESAQILQAQVAEKEEAVQALQAQVTEKEKAVQALQAQVTEKKKAVQALQAQVVSVDSELLSIYRSKWWKLASIYWSLRQPKQLMKRVGRRILPLSVKNAIRSRVYISPPELQPSPLNDHVPHLRDFLASTTSKADYLALFFSGTSFTESEGQRPMRLARELTRRGIPVVFAYWRWSPNESIMQSTQFGNLFQIPIDILLTCANEVFASPMPTSLTRFFLMEFPHPYLFELINLANANGWITIYDVIDDWEEFAKVGQAIWYDSDIERYVALNADLVTVTCQTLADKLDDLGMANVLVVPNALEPGSFTSSSFAPARPRRSELIIGYFGHLTDSWFDWELVNASARRNPAWVFHVIGYGQPPGLELPPNVLLFGKVEHEMLPALTTNWNVAIIPFKRTKLAEAVDPIKVYEYLALRLPVVVTGISHLKHHPYVWVADSEEVFDQLIVKAASTELDDLRLESFLAQNTWAKRVDLLLDAANKYRRVSAVKHAVLAS